jgi:stearoyl-CoA desaturase (Delta-9 desaturase)
VGSVREHTSTASRIVTLIAVVVPALAVFSAAGILWGVALGPLDVALFVVMYVITGLGITVGFHRLFTHRSFKTGPCVRGALAIAGCLSTQGPLVQWATDHRKHHVLSDREGDPHSPHRYGEGIIATVRGLWHAQVGWLFKTKGMERGEDWGRDLLRDPVVRAIDRVYLLWVILSLAIPFAVGFAVRGDVGGGLQAMVWAGLVRVFVFDHVTWSVNSICHSFGSRTFPTADESRNVWLLAIPTFGEAWHNNHHAFPGSAVHGLGRRQVDLSAIVIRGLEKLGLAWDVKRPTEARMMARARAPITRAPVSPPLETAAESRVR